VGGEDDATGVTGPVERVESGVVFGEGRVAGVAEDGLDEIEIAHEGSGGEEADFHGLFGVAARGGADERTEKEGDPAGGAIGLAGGVREGHERGGRLERGGPESGEGGFGDGGLVGGHGESALGDMEQTLGDAAIGDGVVEHALRDAIGLDIGRGEGIAVGGEGDSAAHAGAVEIESDGGDAGGAVGADVTEIGVEKCLDAGVDGGQAAAEELLFLVEAAEERAGGLEEFEIGSMVAEGLAERGEFEIDVAG